MIELKSNTNNNVEAKEFSRSSSSWFIDIIISFTFIISVDYVGLYTMLMILISIISMISIYYDC